MENNQRTALKRQDRASILQAIVKQVEIGTGLNISELKQRFSEDKLFYIGLHYVTTTKKAYCTALNIPVEAGCRYKRTLEKQGSLVQSKDEVICPLTRYPAHLISTNPNEFERLLQSNADQLNLFE